MKKFIILVFILFMLQKAYSGIPHRIAIDVNQVDSVEIKLTDPQFVSRNSCVSREHFDSIFDSGLEFWHNKNVSPEDWDYARVVLREPNQYTLFVRILNSLRPLKQEYVKVLPSEVRLLCPADSVERLDDVMSGETNDPIITNIKYTIYFKDGSTKTAFSSRFYLDFDNWRYADAEYLKSLSYWYKYSYFKPF